MQASEVREMILSGLRKAGEREERERTGLWAGELGTDCDRKLFFIYSGEEEAPTSDESLMTFKWGSAAEEVVAAALEQSGRKVDREVRVEVSSFPSDNPLPITGRIDFLLDDAIEIKSEKKASNVTSGPKMSHVLQAATYGVAQGLAEVFIAYLTKDTNDVIVWSVDVAMAAQILEHKAERGAQIFRAAKSGAVEPPPVPADYKSDKFPCSWKSSRKGGAPQRCPFWAKCWEEE